MKKILIIFTSFSLFLFLTVGKAKAAQPIGFLDQADNTAIAGWAKDDDYNGPIPVHIYVDGQIVQGVTAGNYRSDVGSHGFHWNHPSFGPGNHRVDVYAIGVNSSGQPDTNNLKFSATITEQEEYPLTSSDGKVTVVVNAKFGGSITKILDSVNWPGKNVVVDDHGGALMQSAFWYANSQVIPPNCPPDRGDMLYLNPTQGGYYADVVVGTKYGNPIGYQGNDTRYLDPNEFIRYEDSGKIVHFKSKFIRHDYCKDPKALIENKSLWDTDFYIEQWVSFYPNLPRTLKLRSKISYVGTAPQDISNRQIPIIFANYLPRLAYWKNGSKTIFQGSEPYVNPDANWAAIIASDKEAGVGFVMAPTTVSNNAGLPLGKFSYDYQGDRVTTFSFMSNGIADLSTMGKVIDVIWAGNHIWRFNPGGTFEWYTYYPIGTLDMIKQNSEAILADLSNFGMTPPSPTPIPCSNVPVNCGGWSSCSLSCGSGTQTRTCYDQGCGSTIPQSQACNTQACCSGSYGNCTEWSSCSLSCGGGTQSRTCYDTGCGTSQPQSQSCSTQACPTNTPTPSPTPLPILGDINHDYKVDIYDYNILIADFGKTNSPADIDGNGMVDIYDYNTLVGSFGLPAGR